MNKTDLTELKVQYNKNLKRFYNGCKYCETHTEEIDKWIAEILTILNNIEWILVKIEQYEKVDKKAILEGFKI